MWNYAGKRTLLFIPTLFLATVLVFGLFWIVPGDVVPLWWNSSGATFDWRLRNWHAPQTVQLVHKWDHVYWDPDAKKPTSPGYVP